MALTVEELQIVLSCDATTAQAVLEKMDATVKAYTQKFQKYFNAIWGKGGKSSNPLGNVAENMEREAKSSAKSIESITKRAKESLKDMVDFTPKYKHTDLGYGDISKTINEKIKNGREAAEAYNEEFAKARPSKEPPNTKLLNLGVRTAKDLQAVYAQANKIGSVSGVMREKIFQAYKAMQKLGEEYSKIAGEEGGGSKAAQKAEEAYRKAIYAVDKYVQQLGKAVTKEEELAQKEAELAAKRLQKDPKQVRAGNINAENNPQWGHQGEGRMLAPSFAETFKATLASLPDLIYSFVMKSTNALSKVGSVLGKTFAIGAKVAIGAVRTLGTVVETVARTIGTVLKSAISGLIGTVQKVGGAIKKAFSHTLLGKFLKRLGSVMMRMAAMKLIRGTIDGIKKGLEELAKTSASSAKAMNTIKAAGGSIKMALGVAVMPIVKALAPVFVQLAGAISAAANALARFFAVVTGQSTYTAVNFSGALDDVSESAGGAGKAVKGMLADFDELHVLTKNSGGGGGGSSGVEQSLSTVADVDAVSELGTKLRRAIQSGDWEGIGETLTDLVAGWVAKFDGFIDKVRELNLGKKLAELLNGVFSDQEKWASIGSTFGKGLGVLTTELINFFKNFDFEEFFRSVGAFFSQFAASFFEQLKDVFPEDSWADNLLEGLYAAFSSMTKLFTDNNEWKLAVTNWKATWNGLKISALETWRSILEALDGTKIGDLFGVPEALERNAEKLAEAKEVAEQYELEMRVLNKTIADQKTKTEEATEAQEEYAKGSYSWSGYGQQFRETQEQATASVKAFTEKVTAANTPLGAMTKYMADLVKQKITELIVKATIGGPIDPTEVIEGGKNTGVYSTNTGIALALGVVPQLGDRSKLTDGMNKYVVKNDNPWSAYVNPIYNTGKNFFYWLDKNITGKLWYAKVNANYNTGKDFFYWIDKNITGKLWYAKVNANYNTGKDFFYWLDKNITGKLWYAKVNANYNTGKDFFYWLGKNITDKLWYAKVNPEYGSGKQFNADLQTYVTDKIASKKVNPVYGSGKSFNDALYTNVTKDSANKKVNPYYNSDKDFFDKFKEKITGVTSTTKVNPKLSVPQTYKDAMGDLTDAKAVKIKPELTDAKAFKEQLQSALKASASIKTTVSGTTKTIGKVSMSEYAQGGLAYGLTSAIIGEYAGARNNPEVVAPLNKLQGILERSNTGGNKDTMTREQANTMIGLLRELTKKETVVRPSVELGQVVDRSLKAYART